MREVSADALAKKLIDEPDSMPPILRNLGTALLTGAGNELAPYLVNVARAASKQTEDVQRLTAIVVVDPLRYAGDAAFRTRINALLPQTMAVLPRATAAAILDELDRSAGLDYDTAESIAVAAHLAARSSAAARVAFDRAKLALPDDLDGPITASFYSLSSSFFTAAEASAFLDAVHRASPQRRLIVLGDLTTPAYVERIDTHARPFTPWPRDPFIVARSGERIAFINRPNAQPEREEDQNMVRALVAALPERAQWSVAPLPFHNGQVLMTPAAVRISIHTVETRACAILGVDRIPVETFNEPAGVKRYVDAVRCAAGELRDFYRKPVRFVHPLPLDGSVALMKRLGAGAGVDLDSIVTILPNAKGAGAIVGDLALGARVARAAPAEEWERVGRAYGFRHGGKVLAEEVAAAQSAAALQLYLDEIAAQLRREGITVRRLPLLEVPPSLIAQDLPSPFLMTWNNVVLEKRGNVRRAEGFSSLLASADTLAARTFADSGYRLDLFPPLIRSIELGGGYRCASNHLR